MVDLKDIRRKTLIDKISQKVFLLLTLFCASIIVFIVLFILIRGLMPFIVRYDTPIGPLRVNPWRFMTGGTWYEPPNLYGIGFIIINTLYVVFLAILIAVPISVLTALFIARIAPKKIGAAMNYVVELLASIPSIIYGVFGIGVITAFVRGTASIFGFQSAGGISTIATVLVLAIMIMPTVTMLSISAIKAVRKELVHASLALGTSEAQTNFRIVIPSAKGGIFSGIILGVGRALGEATAVSMVAGNAGSGPTFSLFDTTRTLTSTMLLGLKETTGLDYDIRFSVGIVLIIIIIVTNIILNRFKKRLER
ncbi:MAG: phosphate ABC transporter permease subunit PstC [Erysipelotrichales bacterium]|nr:phosphate ABC transporter permease subunit PstC [Erysipelotrichales bacterium]